MIQCPLVARSLGSHDEGGIVEIQVKNLHTEFIALLDAFRSNGRIAKAKHVVFQTRVIELVKG